MAEVVSNVKIFRQSETNVRVLPSVCRFTTIVGAMLSLDIDGRERRTETYTCLVGPLLKEHEFIGASCLASIGQLEPTTLESAQCVLDSWDAEWHERSGQVEIQVRVSAVGAAARVHILFSVTILAETPPPEA